MKKYVIGIDEVGRGALAGPVVVSAVLIPRNLRFRNSRLGKLKDSKRLAPSKRILWFDFFKSHLLVKYSTSRVYQSKIDKINIAQAANLAAFRALKLLTVKERLPPSHCRILLDGGLYLGNKERPAEADPSSLTVTGGDEKFTAIKMASIIAKVSRDRYMAKLARRYPLYAFEINKGYGTRKHIKTIKKHGPSQAHRLTFFSKHYRI